MPLTRKEEEKSSKKSAGYSSILRSSRVQRCRPPELNFAENDTLFEASLKHMANWLDSMFLYSMIWAFGSILTDEAKAEFEAHLHKVFHAKAQRDKALSEQRRTEEERKARSTGESLASVTESSQAEERYEPTPDFAMGSIDEMQSVPPENMDLFDLFFDPSANAWRPWKHVYTYCLEEKSGFAERIRKHLLTTVCWTQDLLRYRHILDKVCPTNQSLLLF